MAKREMGDPNYESPSQASSRAPKCTRCRNHGILSDLRGHKHQCRFKDCSCNDCLIMAERQRLTAARIALYRQQKVEEPEMLRSGGLELEHSLHPADAPWMNGPARIKDERVGSKRKSDSGNSSPDSFDSDYGGVGVAPTKRLSVESPLTVSSAMPIPPPQEILTRAFPTVSPLVLELVLKGCNGNIVQAIEVVTQSSMLSPPSLPFAPVPPANEASAQGPSPPPLYPASLFKLNYLNGQYRYFVPPGMVPLNSYMFPGAPGLGFPAPSFPAPPPEVGEPAVNSASTSGAFDAEKARENGAETCENCGGRGAKFNGRCSECSGDQRQ